jgi:transposase
MAKRSYRAIGVKAVDVERLVERARGDKLVFGIDAAKEDFKAVLMNSEEEVLITIKWQHPVETPAMVGLLDKLRGAGVAIEAAMEPTGTYGDPVRDQLQRQRFDVFKVSAKRSHDAAEVYDGVASWHDAKSAAIVAMLHLDGRSDLWGELSECQRELKALGQVHEMFDGAYHEAINRLEALLARYWPELLNEVKLTSATVLVLLETFGGPKQVARESKRAAEVMHRASHGRLDAEAISAVIECARESQGVAMLAAEELGMKTMAREANRLRKEGGKAMAAMVENAQDEPEVQQMGAVVGKGTAAVLLAAMGFASGYPSPKAYLKAMGLNLTEKSSGKHQGQLKISKRGPSKPRQWLYLAVLRWIQQDAAANTWYARKVARDGGRFKKKAIVALMRKLVQGLWHVARGASLDSSKLFDTRRLHLGPPVSHPKGLFGRSAELEMEIGC